MLKNLFGKVKTKLFLEKDKPSVNKVMPLTAVTRFDMYEKYMLEFHPHIKNISKNLGELALTVSQSTRIKNYKDLVFDLPKFDNLKGIKGMFGNEAIFIDAKRGSRYLTLLITDDSFSLNLEENGEFIVRVTFFDNEEFNPSSNVESITSEGGSFNNPLYGICTVTPSQMKDFNELIKMVGYYARKIDNGFGKYVINGVVKNA